MWVSEHSGSEKESKGTYSWSLRWGTILVNAQRDVTNEFTIISTAWGLSGDDLAYYQKIGGHDWRVVMRMANAQLSRTEIGFTKEPAPALVLYDFLYDDAFTKDELFRRVRSVVLTSRFLEASTKIGKVQAGMLGAKPKELSDIEAALDSDEDSFADRLRPELTGGSIGAYEFKTNEAFIGTLILSTMGELEKDFGRVLDTRFVIQQLTETHPLPVTLLMETIRYLIKTGFLFEVEEGRIQRVE